MQAVVTFAADDVDLRRAVSKTDRMINRLLAWLEDADRKRPEYVSRVDILGPVISSNQQHDTTYHQYAITMIVNSSTLGRNDVLARAQEIQNSGGLPLDE